jgi:WD40 repeat protein
MKKWFDKLTNKVNKQSNPHINHNNHHSNEQVSSNISNNSTINTKQDESKSASVSGDSTKSFLLSSIIEPYPRYLTHSHPILSNNSNPINLIPFPVPLDVQLSKSQQIDYDNSLTSVKKLLESQQPLTSDQLLASLQQLAQFAAFDSIKLGNATNRLLSKYCLHVVEINKELKLSLTSPQPQSNQQEILIQTYLQTTATQSIQITKLLLTTNNRNIHTLAMSYHLASSCVDLLVMLSNATFNNSPAKNNEIFTILESSALWILETLCYSSNAGIEDLVVADNLHFLFSLWSKQSSVNLFYAKKLAQLLLFIAKTQGNVKSLTKHIHEHACIQRLIKCWNGEKESSVLSVHTALEIVSNFIYFSYSNSATQCNLLDDLRTPNSNAYSPLLRYAIQHEDTMFVDQSLVYSFLKQIINLCLAGNNDIKYDKYQLPFQLPNITSSAVQPNNPLSSKSIQALEAYSHSLGSLHYCPLLTAQLPQSPANELNQLNIGKIRNPAALELLQDLFLHCSSNKHSLRLAILAALEQLFTLHSNINIARNFQLLPRLFEKLGGYSSSTQLHLLSILVTLVQAADYSPYKELCGIARALNDKSQPLSACFYYSLGTALQSMLDWDRSKFQCLVKESGILLSLINNLIQLQPALQSFYYHLSQPIHIGRQNDSNTNLTLSVSNDPILSRAALLSPSFASTAPHNNSDLNHSRIFAHQDPRLNVFILAVILETLDRSLYNNLTNLELFHNIAAPTALLTLISYPATANTAINTLQYILLSHYNPLEAAANTVPFIGDAYILGLLHLLYAPLPTQVLELELYRVEKISAVTPGNTALITSLSSYFPSFASTSITDLSSVLRVTRILHCLRRVMSSSTHAQNAFHTVDGFHKVLTLLVDLDWSKLVDSSDLSRKVAKEAVEYLVQEVLLTISLSIRGYSASNPTHFLDYSLLISIVKSVLNSLPENIQCNETIVTWLYWLATEFLPTDQYLSTCNIINPTNQPNTSHNNLFLHFLHSNNIVETLASVSSQYFQERSNEHSNLHFALVNIVTAPLPFTARISNDEAVKSFISLLPQCSQQFQIRLLQSFNSILCQSSANLTRAGHQDFLSHFINTYRNALLNYCDAELQSAVLQLIHSITPFTSSTAALHSLLNLLESPNQWPAQLICSLVDLAQHSRNVPYLSFNSAAQSGLSFSLNHNFPPPNGYTYSCWLFIDSFGNQEANEAHHINLIQMQSTDSKSFWHLYLDAATGSLHLRTGVKSVHSFNNVGLECNQWYNIVLTHSQSFLSTSSCNLYINAVNMYAGKLNYLTPFNGNTIQAWVGDNRIVRNCPSISFLPNLSKNFSSLALLCGGEVLWRMSAWCLLDEVLPEESIGLLFNAGPRLAGFVNNAVYADNMIDVLSGCYPLTNACSVGLDSVNQSIGKATRRASFSYNSDTLQQEAKLFHISNNSSYLTIDDKQFNHRHLFNSTQLQATPLYFVFNTDRILFYYHAQNSNHKYILNSVGNNSDANNSSADALMQGVHTTIPSSIADQIRSVGGIRRILLLILKCGNSEGNFPDSPALALRQSLLLLSTCLRRNPKNFRDMHNINGYRMLGYILKSIGLAARPSNFNTSQCIESTLIDRSVVEILFSLIGLSDKCTTGRIVNIVALESLILDYKLWEKCNIEVQLYLFQSLLNSITNNWNKVANMAALREVRIVPYLLTLVSDRALDETILVHAVSIIRELLMHSIQPQELHLVADFAITSIMLDRNDSKKVNNNHHDSDSEAIYEASFSTSAANSLSIKISPQDTNLNNLRKGTDGSTSSSNSLHSSDSAAAASSSLPNNPMNAGFAKQIPDQSFRLHFGSKIAPSVRRVFIEMLLDLLVKIKSNNRAVQLYHEYIDFNWIYCVLQAGVNSMEQQQLYHNKNETSSVLALKILMLLLDDLGVLNKFRSSNGFACLTHLLLPYCQSSSIYSVLLTMLMGKSIHEIPAVQLDITTAANHSSWNNLFTANNKDSDQSTENSNKGPNIALAELLPVLMSLLQEALARMKSTQNNKSPSPIHVERRTSELPSINNGQSFLTASHDFTNDPFSVETSELESAAPVAEGSKTSIAEEAKQIQSAPTHRHSLLLQNHANAHREEVDEEVLADVPAASNQSKRKLGIKLNIEAAARINAIESISDVDSEPPTPYELPASKLDARGRRAISAAELKQQTPARPRLMQTNISTQQVDAEDTKTINGFISFLVRLFGCCEEFRAICSRSIFLRHLTTAVFQSATLLYNGSNDSSSSGSEENSAEASAHCTPRADLSSTITSPITPKSLFNSVTSLSTPPSADLKGRMQPINPIMTLPSPPLMSTAQSFGSPHAELFRHETALLLLQLLRQIIVHNLIYNPKGSLVLEEALDQCPVSTNHKIRIRYQSMLLQGLALRFQERLSAAVLAANIKLASNFDRLVQVWQERIGQGLFQRGATIVLQLLIGLLSSPEFKNMLEELIPINLKKARPSGTTLRSAQPMLTAANSLVLHVYTAILAKELPETEAIWLNNFILEKCEVLLGPYNSSKQLLGCLLHHLYRHMNSEIDEIRISALRLWVWIQSNKRQSVQEMLKITSSKGGGVITVNNSTGATVSTNVSTSTSYKNNSVGDKPVLMARGSLSVYAGANRVNPNEITQSTDNDKNSSESTAQLAFPPKDKPLASEILSPRHLFKKIDIYTEGFERLESLQFQQLLNSSFNQFTPEQLSLCHQFFDWLHESRDATIKCFARSVDLEWATYHSQLRKDQLVTWNILKVKLKKAAEAHKSEKSDLHSRAAQLEQFLLNKLTVTSSNEVQRLLRRCQNQLDLELYITQQWRKLMEETQLMLITYSKLDYQFPSQAAKMQRLARAIPTAREYNYIHQDTGELSIYGLEKDSNCLKQQWHIDFIEGPDRIHRRLQRLKLQHPNAPLFTHPYKVFEENKPFSRISSAVNSPNKSEDKATANKNCNKATASETGLDLPPPGDFSIDSAENRAAETLPATLQPKHHHTNHQAKQQSVELNEKTEANLSMSISSAQEDNFYSESEELDELWLMEEERLKLLLDGENISYHYNCMRINGLDEIRGILLFCGNNLFIIDNYEINAQGDIIKLGNANQSSAPQYLNENSFRCSYSDVVQVHKRRYLLRPAALELFLNDGRNYLLVVNCEQRESIYSNVIDSCPYVGKDNSVPLALWTKLWQQGEMSNFEYLMQLNSSSGRTYNDLTQYPVMPFVLRDYSSSVLDLSNPIIYRDLSKPMGALNAERALQFQRRYCDTEMWLNESEIEPFMYGSHYSSAAVVLYYLIRTQPYTQHLIKFQSGRFDRADRLFFSIPHSWLSASKLNQSDVKELIPEFYSLPNFLLNGNNLNLGQRQINDSSINHVYLPAWSRCSSIEFIRLHRAALESDYVSSQLHDWIDLIWGYKQQGPDAVKSLNVFYYLTYAGRVDIDKITDPIVRKATIEQIRSFGQTPMQLFTKAHPHKKLQAKTGLLFTEPQKLIATQAFIYPHGIAQIHAEINSGANTAKLTVTKPNQLLLPNILPASNQFSSFRKIKSNNRKLFIAWNFPDRSVRIGNLDHNNSNQAATGSSGSSSLVNNLYSRIYLNMHDSIVTHCAVGEVDVGILVTAGKDNLVSVWKRPINDEAAHYSFAAVLHGHRDIITALTVSRSYSVILSGSNDSTVILWDLTSHHIIRQLRYWPIDSTINSIDINHRTGYIVVASSNPTQLSVLDINGQLLSQCPDYRCKELYDPMQSLVQVTSLCVCDSTGYQMASSNLFFITGHIDGSIRLWNLIWSDLTAPQSLNGAIAAPRSGEVRKRLSVAKNIGNITTVNLSSNPSTPDTNNSTVRSIKPSLNNQSSLEDFLSDAEENINPVSANILHLEEEEKSSDEGSEAIDESYTETNTSSNPYGWQLIISNQFSAHQSSVSALFISSDRCSFYSGDASGNLIYWSVSTDPAAEQCSCKQSNSHRSLMKERPAVQRQCPSCHQLLCDYCLLNHIKLFHTFQAIPIQHIIQSSQEDNNSNTNTNATDNDSVAGSAAALSDQSAANSPDNSLP